MGLVHMPAGEDTRLHAEGADQSGVALEVYHTDFALTGQPQILSGNVHEDGKPLLISRMPEHQKVWIPGKKILSGDTVGVNATLILDHCDTEKVYH